MLGGEGINPFPPSCVRHCIRWNLYQLQNKVWVYCCKGLVYCLLSGLLRLERIPSILLFILSLPPSSSLLPPLPLPSCHNLLSLSLTPISFLSYSPSLSFPLFHPILLLFFSPLPPFSSFPPSSLPYPLSFLLSLTPSSILPPSPSLLLSLLPRENIYILSDLFFSLKN